MRRLLLVLAAGVAFGLVGASPATAGLRAGPCPVAFDPALTVDCAVLTVPEVRSRPRQHRSHNVQLQVAILRAPTSTPAPDPIVFIDGGPSFNEINPDTVDFLASLPFAATHDIVLYNERGVGFSKPYLGCPEFDQVRADAFASDPFYDGSVPQWLAAVTACRDRLAASRIDLKAYTSESDAADLDALRRALGYKRWNLLAWSADGGVALTEMRLYPKGLRSVILDSAASNYAQLRGPAEVEAGRRMLDKELAGCAADPDCNAAFPDLRARFFARVDAVRAAPQVVDLPVEGGGTYPLTVDADLLLGSGFCGDPFCAAAEPQLLDLAARGDLLDALGIPVLEPAPPNDPFLAEGKSGIFHCHDYIDFEPDSELHRAARGFPEYAGLLTDLRFTYVPTLTREACRNWKVGRADPAQHHPVSSSIPTLVLTGEWDGVVGPLESERIASTLSNSYLFEFPGIGHITAFWDPCPNQITTEFLSDPTVSPDSSCIASMPEISFGGSPLLQRDSTPASLLRPLRGRGELPPT